MLPLSAVAGIFVSFQLDEDQNAVIVYCLRVLSSESSA
jgi:hypothetical protein